MMSDSDRERIKPDIPPGIRQRKILVGAVTVIAVAVAAFLLKQTYFVSMPLVFGFFIAVLLYPLHCRVKRPLPIVLQWLAVVVSFLVIVAVIALFVGPLWYAIDKMAETAPQYQDELKGYWNSFIAWLHSFNIPVDSDLTNYEAIRTQLGTLVGNLVLSAEAFIAVVVLSIGFALLMLLEADRWQTKLDNGLGEENWRRWKGAFHVMTHKVRMYMLVRAGVGVLSAVTEGLWLWAVGVDYALLWALLIFIFNFVPIVGALIAIVPPALFAIVQLGFSGALLAIGGVMIIEQIIANFVDPVVEGFAMRISSVVVLFAVAFWAWIWGIPGALLGVPLMVVMTVILAYFDRTRLLALILSNARDMETLCRDTHPRQLREQYHA